MGENILNVENIVSQNLYPPSPVIGSLAKSEYLTSIICNENHFENSLEGLYQMMIAQ